MSRPVFELVHDEGVCCVQGCRGESSIAVRVVALAEFPPIFICEHCLISARYPIDDYRRAEREASEAQAKLMAKITKNHKPCKRCGIVSKCNRAGYCHRCSILEAADKKQAKPQKRLKVKNVRPPKVAKIRHYPD